MLFTASTRMRRPRPRAMSSLTRMPASSVLPSPTASAIRCAGGAARGPDAPGRADSHEIHGGGVADMDVLVVGHRMAKLALHVQDAVGEPVGLVRDETGVRGIEHLDVGSSAVRKTASRPRTSSETPSQTIWYPPGAWSTRRTIHSAHRTTTRAPGVGWRLRRSLKHSGHWQGFRPGRSSVGTSSM